MVAKPLNSFPMLVVIMTKTKHPGIGERANWSETKNAKIIIGLVFPVNVGISLAERTPQGSDR